MGNMELTTLLQKADNKWQEQKWIHARDRMRPDMIHDHDMLDAERAKHMAGEPMQMLMS